VYPSWKQARARLSPSPGAPSYALVIYINKKQKRYYLRVTTIRRVTPHFALFVGTAAFVKPGIKRGRGGLRIHKVKRAEDASGIQNTFTSGIVSVFFFVQRAASYIRI
jgi:hypothetical protein